VTCLDMMIDSELLDPRRNKDWHCDDGVREVGRDKPTNAADRPLKLPSLS